MAVKKYVLEELEDLSCDEVKSYRRRAYRAFDSLQFEGNVLFQKYVESEGSFYTAGSPAYNTINLSKGNSIRIFSGSSEIFESSSGLIVDDINGAVSKLEAVKSLLEKQQNEDKLESQVDALFNNCTVLYVKKGENIKEPVSVDIKTGSSDPFLGKLIVFLEPDSSASVIIRSGSEHTPPVFYGENIDLVVSEGASLEAVIIQNISQEASLSLNKRLSIAGKLRLTTVDFGGKMLRSRYSINLIKEGAEAEINSVVAGNGSQSFDLTSNLNHKEKSTYSKVNMRAVLNDSSKSLFKGVIRQEKNAVKSSAYLSEHSILLGKNAKSNSIPSLEIETDDVKASHSASSHPVEEEKIFYLMSRGIERSDAIELITFGFVNELLGAVASDDLEDIRKIFESKTALKNTGE